MRTDSSFIARSRMTAWPLWFQRLSHSVVTISAGLFLLLWLYSYLCLGLYDAFNFDGFPADGPFQLFNPLRRITAGQRPGIDFQFFHGIGVPYLHYPIFWLSGKTIYASELSRYLTSLLVYVASLLVFAWVSVRRSWSRMICFVALAACLAEMFDFRGTAERNDLALPGNSLLGVRSFLPIICFAVLLSGLRNSTKALIVGVCLAVSFFVSTEHGLAVVVSFVISGFLIIASTWLRRRTHAAESEDDSCDNFTPGFYLQTLAVAAGSVILLYLLFCGYQGGLQALRYNLLEVPKDQFWYFGVPPNDFADSWMDFPRSTIRGCLLLIAVLLWLGWQITGLFRKPSRRLFQESTLLHLLIYAMLSCVSCLGMLEKGYLYPMLRVLTLAVLLLAFRENWLEQIRQMIRQREGIQGTLMMGAIIMLIGFLFFGASLNLFSRIPSGLRRSPDQPLLHLSVLWKKYLSETSEEVSRFERQAMRRPVIWSTYAGLLEDRFQVFHSADDYIIHALGPTRRQQYLEKFRQVRPDFVQTVRRSLFINYTREQQDYEQWLQNTSWEFYEDVLSNYEIARITDRFFLWRKKSSGWNEAQKQAEEIYPVNPETTQLQVPPHLLADGTRLLTVRMTYEIRNPWRGLPVIGSLPRYLVEPEAAQKTLPISLPPYASEISFPLIVKPGQVPCLNWQTHSLIPGAGFTVTSVAYRKVVLSENQKPFLED